MGYKKNAIKTKHESMGLCGISRISGRNDRMFGSDVPHSSWMELRIVTCTAERDLSREWYHRDNKLISIELTSSQFSEMISNMNCGDGVPCTIKSVLGKRMEPPLAVDRTGQFSEEFKGDMKKVASRVDGAIDAMTTLLAKNGASKKEKNNILKTLDMLKQDLEANMPFVEKQFRRCLVKATDDAKRNAENHILNIALNSANRGLVTKQEAGQVECELKDYKLLEGE